MPGALALELHHSHYPDRAGLGMSKIQSAIKMGAVPREKFLRMAHRTVIGVVFIAFGVASAALWSFPWYVSATSVGLGTHIWSGQLVGNAIRSALPLIRELVAAVTGGKSSAADRDDAPTTDGGA